MKDATLNKACAEVDAALFMGDVLEDDETRKDMRMFAERWLRAIDIADNAASQETVVVDEDDDWSFLNSDRELEG